MFYKSKYDIIEKESFTSSMNLLFLAGKIAKDMKALKAGKISKPDFDNSFFESVSKGVPSIETIAHIGYENSLDIAKVNKKAIQLYMQKEGLTLEEFQTNYNRMINTYVKIILAFGIIEKENLSVYKVVTPEVLLGLIKGDFSLIKDIINGLGTDVSEESKALMDKLVDTKSKIENLSEEEKKFLTSEHDKFMRKKVLPYIKKDSTDSDVLKFSKSLGNKKSVLEL